MSTLGQSVIVEPKPGAGERIAAQYLTTQPPDGYTLYLITGGANVISATDPQVTFSTLKDFSYISTITLFPFALFVAAKRALQDAEGFHRRGPRAARQAQLWACRHRQHAASRRRAPEGADRHPDRAGRLQGPGAADQRRDRGPPRRLDQHLHQLPQRAQLRPGARPVRHLGAALAAQSRRPDRGRGRAGLRGRVVAGPRRARQVCRPTSRPGSPKR